MAKAFQPLQINHLDNRLSYHEKVIGSMRCRLQRFACTIVKSKMSCRRLLGQTICFLEYVRGDVPLYGERETALVEPLCY